MVNSCFIGKRSGVESSSMTRCPPVFSRGTSQTVLCPALRSCGCRTLRSRRRSFRRQTRGRCSPPGQMKSCPRGAPALLFSRSTFIMPSEMSVPIRLSGCSSRHARMAKSPVPVATSIMRRGRKGRRYLIASPTPAAVNTHG